MHRLATALILSLIVLGGSQIAAVEGGQKLGQPGVVESPRQQMVGGPVVKRCEVEVVLARISEEPDAIDPKALSRLAELGTQGYSVVAVVPNGRLLVYTLERTVMFRAHEWERQHITVPEAVRSDDLVTRLRGVLQEVVRVHQQNALLRSPAGQGE